MGKMIEHDHEPVDADIPYVQTNPILNTRGSLNEGSMMERMCDLELREGVCSTV